MSGTISKRVDQSTLSETTSKRVEQGALTETTDVRVPTTALKEFDGSRRVLELGSNPVTLSNPWGQTWGGAGGTTLTLSFKGWETDAGKTVPSPLENSSKRVEQAGMTENTTKRLSENPAIT